MRSQTLLVLSFLIHSLYCADLARAEPLESRRAPTENESDLADDVNGGKPIELTRDMIEQFADQLGLAAMTVPCPVMVCAPSGS